MAESVAPMSRRETAREIDEAAALWAARVEARALSAAEEAELDAWLGGDARRAGAFAKARATALTTERAAALTGFEPERFAEPRRASPSRRMLLGAGAASAMAAAAGAFWVWREAGIERYATELGQVRVVSLEDGSIVTLNTASEIAVRFGDAARTVSLVAGEALFDVARDAAWPFVVEAGAVMVRALGTSFSVRRLAHAPAEVLVREGVVEMTRRDGRGAAAVRIEANRRAAASAAATVTPVAVAPADVSRALAWRDGRLAFEGETLREAAAEFARYSETRIVFEDPAIADETVTGLFVSTDPVGFSRAVAVAFDLEVEVGQGEVRLSR